MYKPWGGVGRWMEKKTRLRKQSLQKLQVTSDLDINLNVLQNILLFHKQHVSIIRNGNRTEWSPIRSVKARSSDLFITSMITDRIGRHEVLLPINHKNYNFRGKERC